VRVPIWDASMVDLVVDLKKKANVEEVNAAMKKYAEGSMKGILEYCEDPIVSVDIIGNSHSCIFDSLATMAIGDHMIKVIAWYDNEWGYSCRMVDILVKMARM